MSNQDVLLNQIRKQLLEKESINDEIASVLNISYDAAHRRVSGKSKFSIDETVQLCNNYNISMDKLFFQKEKIIVEKTSKTPPQYKKQKNQKLREKNRN